MKQGSARLLLCVTCLLLLSWTVRASEPAPTSPEPSWTQLTEGEIAEMLLSEAPYNAQETASLIVAALVADRQVQQETAVDAAAAAVAPVLVELAGVTAERDSLRDSRNVWRLIGFGGILAAVIAGIIAAAK